jgi:hypothetical protein
MDLHLIVHNEYTYKNMAILIVRIKWVFRIIWRIDKSPSNAGSQWLMMANYFPD